MVSCKGTRKNRVYSFAESEIVFSAERVVASALVPKLQLLIAHRGGGDCVGQGPRQIFRRPLEHDLGKLPFALLSDLTYATFYLLKSPPVKFLRYRSSLCTRGPVSQGASLDKRPFLDRRPSLNGRPSQDRRFLYLWP